MITSLVGTTAYRSPTIADRLAGSGPLARDAVLGALVIAL